MAKDYPLYGGFPGGDPRDFEPDEDCCTNEEIENHRKACQDWDNGIQINLDPSCSTFGDGSLTQGTGFGIGTYYIDYDEEEK